MLTDHQTTKDKKAFKWIQIIIREYGDTVIEVCKEGYGK